jgi:CheY-like chemotaxis protein
MGCIDSEHFHILLAEDNPVNQKIAQRMLKHLGYPVDVAANGLEALQALEHKSYNIILMDTDAGDGRPRSHRIIRQRLSAEEQPRIIAVTAHALDYSREMCIDAGMDDYIAKPVQKDELAEVLNRYQPSRDGF